MKVANRRRPLPLAIGSYWGSWKENREVGREGGAQAANFLLSQSPQLSLDQCPLIQFGAAYRMFQASIDFGVVLAGQ